jgi:hypothetical protein
MSMSSQERQRRNLAHARWRVEFLLSLLDVHRSNHVHRPGWTEKEAAYLHQIAEAQVELDREEWRTHVAGMATARGGFP